MLSVVRRVGTPPKMRGSSTELTCPDIFELSDGRFAVIGTDMTAELDGCLPGDAARGPRERIVVISRETLLDAMPDPAVVEALILSLVVGRSKT